MLFKVVKTYGGEEGVRVKAGTTFWAGVEGEKPEGVRQIRLQRAKDLKGIGILKQISGEPIADAAPGARPEPIDRPKTVTTPKPRNQQAPKPSTPEESPARRRSVNRAATAKEKQPRAPAKVKAGETQNETSGQSGSQTGKDEPPSSSGADPQTKTSTSKTRGTRRRGSRSTGSQSTTASGSSAGPKSSTPATPDGGNSTTEKSSDSSSAEASE